MKISDLWIGEWVILKDSGTKGKYEGIATDGQLKINTGGKYCFTSIENINVIDEPLPLEPVFEDTNGTKKASSVWSDKETIDLHIEKLAPGMEFSIPSRILTFQISACKRFIETGIMSGSKILTIIHGKGEGILKSEVLHLLKSYGEVKFVIPSPNGGSLEVWLN